MKTLKRLVLFIAFLASYAVANAGQNIPMDSAIRYGKLDNGLTYYIRYNNLPKERADFYIAQNVGAILEEDSQNGLAHFLEHMAFNGTKNYPDLSLRNYLESIGAKFGTNLNAYTSLDETVYMLREIPVTRPSIIDSAILILHDWSSFITLDGKEIDKERGVIREEWRTGAHANRRMWKEGNKKKFPGSQYAKRDIIGDTAVINNFPYDTLRAYYKKWYRPDQQAIIIVGDINVDSTEQSLKRIFADIKAPVNPAERIIYPIYDNEKPIVSIVTDPEARYSSFELDYKHKPLPDQVKGNTEGYNRSLVNSLITIMMSDRFNKLTQHPSCPFVDGYAVYSDITRSSDAFMIGVVAKDGREKQAFEALLKESERIKRYGFIQSEYDRAVIKFTSMMEKAYKERDKQKSKDYVQEYIRNFLEKEPIPGIEWEYNYALKALKEKINLELLNKIAQSYITPTNLIVDISAPENAKLPNEEEVLQSIALAQKNFVNAYTEEQIKKPLLKKTPKAETITKESTNETLGTTEWMLSNGIRVILKPTTYKNDQIIFTAFSDGGTSLIQKIEDLPSAVLAEDIVRNNGLGKLNKVEINRLLAGKQVSISASIDTNGESMSGSSSVADLETMFKLTYLTFTAPRKDKMAYAAFMQEMETELANRSKDPRSAYSDSLNLLLTNHSPRVILMNKETLKKVNQNTAYKIYKDRFENPADFTFVFVGSFNIDSIKPLILTYLGGMKTSADKETWKDNNVRYPKGEISKTIEQKMEVNKASVYLFAWADMPYNFTNSMNLNALEDILDLRYTESIREEEGGTYGVRVDATAKDKPVEQATLAIRFDTDPEKAEKLIGIAKAQLDSIMKNGVRADDLDKVKKNYLKQYKDNQIENGWWMNTIVLKEKKGINRATEYEKAVNDLSSESIQKTLKALMAPGNFIDFKIEPKNEE